jgi:predicted nucleic acid-binding protein
LDTNVLSELHKPHCDKNVRAFTELIPWDNLYISSISIGELCYGMEKLPPGKKKHELQIWLYSKVMEWFKNRIVQLETEIFLEWGKIRANAERTLPVVDTMIAASAITHRMFLVTRNTADFTGIEGLNLLNPWEY